MFFQHFAGSLSMGDRGRDSRRFADLTVDTAAIFAQTGTLAIDCFQRMLNGSKSDRVHDPAGHR